MIIGAGPAGLFTAANVSCRKVLLLEKKESPGKKLLISGSGRCNLTHSGTIGEFIKHYGDAGRFARNALYQFSNLHLIEWFTSRGLDLATDKNGKLFPASEKAKDVLETLLAACRRNGVDILYNQAVSSVEIIADGFRISDGYQVYHGSSLVIATGGLSYPSTGSNGDGFRFAQNLGHTLCPLKPALTPVINRVHQLDQLAGVSLKDLKMSIFRDGKKMMDIQGDIGFTHKGISGPGILDSSRYMQAGDELRINFAGISPDELRKQLVEAASKPGKTTLISYLKNFDLPRSLLLFILDSLNVPIEQQLSCLEKGQRNRIIDGFTGFSLPIQAMGGYKEAMVTAGGVIRSEVNPATMESKLVPGLYFTGEVIDVDGDTGGYNLQFAFSSGYLAAMAITGKYKKRTGS